MAKSEQFTCKQVIEAIKNSRGLKAAIARRLGCHVNTVNNYIKRHPSVAEAYQDEREAIVDLAESVILKALQADDATTARWACATLGKDRGWVERKEVTGKDERPLFEDIAKPLKQIARRIDSVAAILREDENLNKDSADAEGAEAA